MTTQETRRAAYDAIKHKVPTRAQKVLEVLANGRELTAREIMRELGYTDPNYVRPRLTELVGSNMVEVVGKRKDIETGKMMAVYKAVQQ